MAKGKSCWGDPDCHLVSHIGPLTNDDIAELSDAELERYLTQNGYLEEKRLYRANPDFIVRKIAGETLAVPTGTAAHELNAAIILTEGGALLWDCLSRSPQTRADLSGALQRTYDVDPETAARDVSRFLEKAVGEGIVCQM
ncbi:MAG: PqqD family protein [Clostridiales bacterium]|nr:PqqD family protein [Clostridiales bacterium]